ncbi:DUF808 domain-containing protein, partial [Sphingomonas sp. HMWF008]
MLWVGGGILIHGFAQFGFAAPEHLIHDAAVAVGHGSGIIQWAVTALGGGLVGLAAGALVVGALHLKPGAKH